MIGEAIKKVTEKVDLTENEAYRAMLNVMDNAATDVQKASFLTGLKLKGETADEIVGFVKAIREKACLISPKVDFLIDTCGTGGDRAGTFNISTAAAIIAASCGAKVAKHGNSSVSSKCGSADVFRELGVNTDISPEHAQNCIENVGIGFLFAPTYHKAMKNVAPVRKELGIRTVFNILGPLLNPANANGQVLGVYDESLMNKVASVLKQLGVQRAMVVHGNDGLDEISISGITKVVEINADRIRYYEINPEDYGIPISGVESILGGAPRENAAILKDVLAGKEGPKLDIAVLNSAAVLYIAGVAKNLDEGITKSRESIKLGSAKAKLHEMVSYTNLS